MDPWPGCRRRPATRHPSETVELEGVQLPPAQRRAAPRKAPTSLAASGRSAGGSGGSVRAAWRFLRSAAERFGGVWGGRKGKEELQSLEFLRIVGCFWMILLIKHVVLESCNIHRHSDTPYCSMYGLLSCMGWVQEL